MVPVALGEHVTFLPAPVRLVPATTLTLLTLETEYAMVHCTAAVWAPPVLAMEMFKVTVPPGTVLAELKERFACCASAGLAIKDKSATVLEANTPALEDPQNFNEHLQHWINCSKCAIRGCGLAWCRGSAALRNPILPG